MDAAALQTAWAQGDRDLVRAYLAPVLAASHDAAESLLLAGYADELGEAPLHRRALEQTISLDRNSQVALLALAGVMLERGEGASTLLLLEEAARVAPLPAEVEALRVSLAEQAGGDAFVQSYFAALSRQVEPSDRPRKILLVTNFFPPQELGGYGRMMWEFAHALRARGHEVRVLAGNSPMLAKQTTAAENVLEPLVSRRLELMGVWLDGKPVPLTDEKKLVARMRHNARLIRNTARAMGADVLLAGNLDLVGVNVVDSALEAGVPVVHALANAGPGWAVTEQPVSPKYWVAPCSHWNGAVLQQAGYAATRVETVYPGARLDYFYRLFLPDTRRLRLCYASLVLPYKGAHTFVDSLLELDRRGVDFTAEIAGDAPDEAFRAGLLAKFEGAGLAERVRFTGFLDRPGLSALFARSNVLVFPSMFEEPFGISQVEAMAAGLVVVTSGTGGAREIVRDGVDGLRFPAGNAPALADRLAALAQDPELFSRLQQGAQTRATEFSVSRAARQLEGLFDELLQA